MDKPIKDVEIRRATSQDVALFYGEECPRTCYAWIAFYKGKAACVAGLTVDRRAGCIAFSEIKPDINAPKITIWRTAKQLSDKIVQLGFPMYAACDLSDKMAQEFVKRLGFIRQRNYQGMELFVWPR